MTAEEYIKQQITAGYNIHMNNGVWWQKRSSFYYRPVNLFQGLKPGTAKPKISKSFLGYSHLVVEDHDANECYPMMILSHDKLKEFSLEKISSNKRRRIRKGLKLTEVKRITNISEAIDDIQQICMSAAERTGYGLPPEYYVENYDKWKSYMFKEFSLPNREWWGAYHDGLLIAYRYDVLIDSMMFNIVLKSRTDHLDKCPNDALMYTFIDYCKTLDNCQGLNATDYNPRRPGINKFKELFGFEKVDLPMYKKYTPLAIIGKKILQFMQRKNSKDGN